MKVPPQVTRIHESRVRFSDLGLEREFLGACIVFPDLVLSSEVKVSDFSSGAHELIFGALLHLLAEGDPVSTGAVRGHLYDRGLLATINGGEDYLLSLTDGIPSRDVDSRRLRRLARERQLHDASAQLSQGVGTDAYERAIEKFDAARKELEQLVGRRSPVTFRSTAELFAPLEATPWVVPTLHLGPGRPGLWAGYGSSAKTLSAQALALAVASGIAAFDHFPISTYGIVRHIDFEQGFRATAKRYQRLALGHGIDQRRLAERLQLAVFPDLYLDSPGATDAWAKTCDGATLVIVDAFRGATPTRDENDSSIRVCLDNLTRVSERTGATFLVVHHAGKPKDVRGAAQDTRTVARGSSAIFDACGVVFILTAGADKSAPRHVTEAKPPAEAEGATLDDFELAVEDVAIGGNHTAGVRVLWRPVEVEHPLKVADERFTRELDLLVQVIEANPGASQNIVMGKAGINRNKVARLLQVLEEQGRIVASPGARGALHYRIARGDRER